MLEMGYGQRNAASHHAPGMTSTGQSATPLSTWLPPVLQTVAIESRGIQELLAAIEAHRHYLHESGAWQVKERQALQEAIQHAVELRLIDDWQQTLPAGLFEEMLQTVVERKLSPEAAAQALLEHAQWGKTQIVKHL
jgi:LAO/AO transport system kinase